MTVAKVLVHYFLPRSKEHQVTAFKWGQDIGPTTVGQNIVGQSDVRQIVDTVKRPWVLLGENFCIPTFFGRASTGHLAAADLIGGKECQ